MLVHPEFARRLEENGNENAPYGTVKVNNDIEFILTCFLYYLKRVLISLYSYNPENPLIEFKYLRIITFCEKINMRFWEILFQSLDNSGGHNYIAE